jgi:cytochrome P450
VDDRRRIAGRSVVTDSCEARRYDVQDLTGLRFDPVLAELLRERPVARVRLPHGEGVTWVVTRYRDVRFVTSDPRFSRAAVPGASFSRMTRHAVPLDRAVSYADPPEHARIRGVVSRAFTQSAVDGLRPEAERRVRELIEGMVRDGAPGELVRRVTSPFPVGVIGTVLGVPSADWPLMVDWAQTVLSVASDQEAADRVAAVKAEASAYFRELTARRRSEPREDLLTTLVRARDEGVLSEEEMIALTVLLQFNGWHAVRNNSSMMVYTLLTRPRLWNRVRAEPALLPRAVEELLRFIPHKSGLGQPRIATEDVEVGGTLIRAGEAVYVSYVTANWDEEVFPDPGEVDIDRPEVPHLAFGHGPHYCMAPSLARMESEVLLAALVERLPGLRLAVPVEQVRWPTGCLIRGPVELPVAWD